MEIDRSWVSRKAENSNRQFSLVANTSFQFWESGETFEEAWEKSKVKTTDLFSHWWFQPDEPQVPEGWVAGSEWWVCDPATEPTVKCRIIYHLEEKRRLDDDQIKCLKA